MNRTCPICKVARAFGHVGGRRGLVCDVCNWSTADRIPREVLADKGGVVYILSNPAMGGMVKIGHTKRDVPRRVRELSSHSGVPEPFVIEAEFKSPCPADHERAVHHRLKDRRVPGREFFRLSAVEAIKVVRDVVGSPKTGRGKGQLPHRWMGDGGARHYGSGSMRDLEEDQVE